MKNKFEWDSDGHNFVELSIYVIFKDDKEIPTFFHSSDEFEEEEAIENICNGILDGGYKEYQEKGYSLQFASWMMRWDLEYIGETDLLDYVRTMLPPLPKTIGVDIKEERAEYKLPDNVIGVRVFTSID